MSVQSLDKAERVEHILRILTEMIAVVIILQFCETFLVSHPKIFAQSLNVGSHHGFEFRLAYSADGGILVKHAYIVQVVEFAEDAELRELGNACDEDELQIRV